MMQSGFRNYSYVSKNEEIARPKIKDDTNLYFEDEFDSPMLKDGWRLVNIPSQTDASTIFDIDTTIPSAAYVYAYPTAIKHCCILRLMPEGNFDAVLEMSALSVMSGTSIVGLYLSSTNVDGTGTQIPFNSYNNAGNYNRFVASYINFESFAGGGIAELRWNNYAYRTFVRITRTGPTQYYESWSLDGIVWTERRSFTHATVMKYIGPGLIKWSSGTPAIAAFHSFRIFTPSMPLNAYAQPSNYLTR